MGSRTLVDLCAGAAAVSLRALAGARLDPPVSWMGGKRSLAGDILAAMGWEGRPDRVVLVDAGPWGWVWPVLLDPEQGARVCVILREWEGSDPRALWDALAAEPPAEDLAERAAQWLWLQCRAPSGVPIVWREGQWWKGSGSKATQRGRDASRPVTGIIHPATIADRIDAIRWAVGASGAQVEVRHCDVSEVEPIPGSVVYFDPPYVGCTGYGWDCARAEVLAVAQRWADAGCLVAVSEAVPLDLEGWHPMDLTPRVRRGGKPEWLTLSRPPVRSVARQVPLLEVMGG